MKRKKVSVPSWLRGLPRGHERKRVTEVIPHKNARKSGRSNVRVRVRADGE